MRRMMISGAAVAAVLLAGAAAPALATAPAAHPVADLNSCGYTVAGESVNLRSGAGTRYASLGHLQRGDSISVDKKAGDWYRVTVDERSKTGIKAGTVGWASAKYIKPATCMQLD